MIGDPVLGQEIAVVINPRHRTAGAQGDICHVIKGFDGVLNPSISGQTVDHITVDGRAPAPSGRLLQDHDTSAIRGGGEGGLQTGNPATGHQHVAEGIGVFVVVGVDFLRRFTKTGGVADHRFENVLPGKPRVDEGFVVKAAGQEPREAIVDHARIKLKARPVVLAVRLQTAKGFGGGRALVGFQPCAAPEVNERVRLLHARGYQPARSVVFEAAPDQHLVIGQQRGRKGIALKPAQALAVEGEFQREGAVNQTAAFGQTGAHARPPLGLNPGQSGRLAFILACRSGGGAEDCAG